MGRERVAVVVVALMAMTLAGCASGPEKRQVSVPEIQGADLDNGKQIYNAKCTSCHKDPYVAVGPRLQNVFGQEPCHLHDYPCTAALRAAVKVWDYQTLDRFLEEPATFAPGNRMSFAGVKDAKDRKDLIAYLILWPRKKAEWAY